MKIVVTGGTSGLGEYLCEHLPGSQSFSRANGFDITKDSGRARIAEESLSCDIIINNAFDGPAHESYADLGQVKLLKEIFNLWNARSKIGYIINISSIASLFPIREWNSFQTYRFSKLALDEASFFCTRAFLNDQVPFRTSLIRQGRMDTVLARSRANWTGNGISLKYLTSSIQHLTSAPQNTCPYNIDLDVNLNWQGT